MSDKANYLGALSDFRDARTRAVLQEVVARLTGRSEGLLPFDEISEKLRASGRSDKGLHEIPVNAIVGSVSRYSDYTRSFLPLKDSDKERWARVKAEITRPGASGLSPIEVYKLGEAYFVRDGHHRVSVARQMGIDRIEAYVTEIQPKVPVTPDDKPEDIILKAEYADFLAKTHLDEYFPDANLRLTFPGMYRVLEEHIQVHQYFMGLDYKRDISYSEAVRHWYETVYLPVVRVIRELGALREFPGRTEADLYLWLSDHRDALQKEMGWQVRPEVAAKDLVIRESPRLMRTFSRIKNKVRDWLVPDPIDEAPDMGEWYKERKAGIVLFNDILVAVSGEDTGWSALEQAMVIGSREGSRLNGLYVASGDEAVSNEKAQSIRDRFDRMLGERGLPGNLAVTEGEIARQICNRVVLNDLLVLNLAHPPGERITSRVTSGFHTILRRCPRPVLAVPGAVTPIDRMLLAFDGSVKAREALYLSTYFAARWNFPLVVLTVKERRKNTQRIHHEAKAYLEEHQVEATFVSGQGTADEAILRAAQEQGSNIIILGGYGYLPVVEIMLGSTVDGVLRKTSVPVLICH